jgi:putative addiction module killer protein
MEAQPREIEYYLTADERCPFLGWVDALRDLTAKAKIRIRLDRIKAGNLGDYRSVGEGVCEFRIQYGPGYRIYFGQIGNTIVLLLCGGDKSTQQRDIRQAIEYWREYRSQDNA